MGWGDSVEDLVTRAFLIFSIRAVGQTDHGCRKESGLNDLFGWGRKEERGGGNTG